jgi:glycosyltransferase involved in cell wall biosynthesis
MIRRPPWYPHVRHLGYVSDEERQRLYREASMLVIPSLDEGFGMPALEAMTVGVPVVAANRGALPEVVQDGGILVDPLDESALAGAMQRLLTDRGVAQQYVARGFARAARYSWAASASRLLRAYQDVLADRRPG